MSDEIEIKETMASPVSEVLVQEARPSGWMGWYRYSTSDIFSQVFDSKGNEHRDYHRCPYPLFQTREDVVEAGRKCMHGRGGELRIVKVVL